MTQSERERPAPAGQKRPSRISMHEGMPDWDDCCTCAAEPYWLEEMARNADTTGEPQGAAEHGRGDNDSGR